MYQEKIFGGLLSSVNESKVRFDRATKANNCILDQDVVEKRGGFRPMMANNYPLSPTLLGKKIHGLWRHKPNNYCFTEGGDLYTIGDCTSKESIDSFVSSTPSLFSNSPISCTELGKFLYMTDSVVWKRIATSTIETLVSLQKGTVPVLTFNSQSFTKFKDLSTTPVVNGGSNYSTYATDWHRIQNTGNNAPCPDGGSIQYKLDANTDWSGVEWVAFVIASPTSSNGGNGGSVYISVAKDVSGSPGTFEVLGNIHDNSDTSPGSPNLVYVNLNGLSSSVKSAIRYIKCSLSTTAAGDNWATLGFLPINGSPGLGEQQYRVTFYHSVTKNESDPTDTLLVEFPENALSFTSYRNVYGDKGTFKEEGTRVIDPERNNEGRDFNKGSGFASPNRGDFTQTPTFTGNIPTGSQYPNSDTVRLWRLTESGWRVVTTKQLVGGETTYSLTDNKGDSILSGTGWKPNGGLPKLTTLSSWGGRLFGGFQNTLYVSDFVPFGEDTDPYPKFAKLAIEEANGWQAEISPSKTSEEIIACISGDVPYILTNQRVMFLPSLFPTTTPELIYHRGVIGRNAVLYAEASLFWVGSDGVYFSSDRASVTELTVEVRDTFYSWLEPDDTVCMGYKDRKLYVFKGNKFIRYDFVSENWTTGTSNLSISQCLSYKEGVDYMLIVTSDGYVGREDISYKKDCYKDIGDWDYQTGWLVSPKRVGVESLFFEVNNAPSILTIENEYNDKRSVSVIGVREEAFSADLAGYKMRLSATGIDDSVLVRLMLEVNVLDEDSDTNN